MVSLVKDLREEQDALDVIVAPLCETERNRATPFEDWTIRDQITHLAYFDGTGCLAATDEAAFARHTEERNKNRDRFEDDYLWAGRSLACDALLSDWRHKRASLLHALAVLDPKKRMPWYGPPMSARSFATARLMETWAHGQDVADALGMERAPTERLRHIAHIGVTTFQWSFRNHGLAIPDAPVYIELTSPAGDRWTWGPEDVGNRISGTALDFCLVVTQRRHAEDTDISACGDAAKSWMRIAQAFAGPPTMGPKPGSFRKAC